MSLKIIIIYSAQCAFTGLLSGRVGSNESGQIARSLAFESLISRDQRRPRAPREPQGVEAAHAQHGVRDDQASARFRHQVAQKWRIGTGNFAKIFNRRKTFKIENLFANKRWIDYENFMELGNFAKIRKKHSQNKSLIWKEKTVKNLKLTNLKNENYVDFSYSQFFSFFCFFRVRKPAMPDIA